MTQGAVIARIISQYSDKGSKAAQKDIKKLGADFDKMGAKVSKAFTVAAAASAAFAIKIGTDAVKAAINDQKSQALLANSLYNTVGANKAVLASVEAYILKTQLATGVTDEQLRPSLAALAMATGDVAKAQGLQSLALDIAASKSKDLGAVSLALAKAYGGNFTALRRLGVPLSENLVKSKDFIGITKELAAATAGAAATAADTLAGRLNRMKVAYDEILESLGYALLPVVQKFAEYLVNNVLPAIQKWVDINKDQLAKGLQNTVNVLIKVGKAGVAFTKWMTSNKANLIITAGILSTMFVAPKVAAFIIALTAIGKALVALRAFAMTTAIATAFATGGVSIATAATALAVIGVTALATKRAFSGVDTVAKKTSYTMLDISTIMADYIKKQKASSKVVTETITGVTNLTAAEAKLAEMRATIKKAGLDNFGIKNLSNTDPIELEAVRLNLIKQQQLGISLVAQSILDALEAQMRGNVAAQRYVDIMAVMKDNKITSTEIDMLAQKWGVSAYFVKNYITEVMGLDSLTLNKDFGAAFAASWDLATAAYRKYLEALKAGSGAVVGGTGTGTGTGTGSGIPKVVIPPSLVMPPKVVIPPVVIPPVVIPPSAIPGVTFNPNQNHRDRNYDDYLASISAAATGNSNQNRDRNYDDRTRPQTVIVKVEVDENKFGLGVQDTLVRLNRGGDYITTAGSL